MARAPYIKKWRPASPVSDLYSLLAVFSMYAVQVRGPGIKGSELQEESGTETHTLAAKGTPLVQYEGKKARAGTIKVAAAQRQPLPYEPLPVAASGAANTVPNSNQPAEAVSFHPSAPRSLELLAARRAIDVPPYIGEEAVPFYPCRPHSRDRAASSLGVRAGRKPTYGGRVPRT